MTDAEREDFETNPLWSEEGQVLWLLEQQDENAELLTSSKIAAELKITAPAASAALRQLLRKGKAASRSGRRSELWGTSAQAEQVRKAELRAEFDRAARRTQIVEHNKSPACSG